MEFGAGILIGIMAGSSASEGEVTPFHVGAALQEVRRKGCWKSPQESLGIARWRNPWPGRMRLHRSFSTLT